MNQPQQPPVKNIADDEIDLRELFKVIWQGKWIIITTTFVFAAASVFYALSLPNIYKSEALLAPATEQQNAGLSGQLGGLAALAGVSLGGGTGIDKTALAIEVLKSRDFLGRFIENRIQLHDLMAAKSWDLNSNTIRYDEEIYNLQTQQWIAETKPPKQSKPSAQQAYKVLSNLLVVNQDKVTGMINVSIEHVSPYIAQNWVQMLIADLNFEMRTRDIDEAKKSIAYLQQQIEQTNIADLRSALFSLIEEQTKTLMLASVRDEYALKIIDRPIVPEEKAGPARALICLVFSFFGGFVSILVVLIRALMSNKE